MYSSFDYTRQAPILTPEESSALDIFSIEQAKVESRLLMGWAGYSAFSFLLRQKKFTDSQAIHILAGKGNNGGDGFALAYHILSSTNRAVRVWLEDEPRSEDAKYYFQLCETFTQGNRFEVSPLEDILKEEIKKATVVEALYGNGFKGTLKPEIEKIFHFVNANPKIYRVALDIAAGVLANADVFSHEAFNADVTIAFGSVRVGQLLEPGIFYGGKLKIMPIGFYPDKKFMVQRKFLQKATWKTARILKAHKYLSGELRILGGSKTMEGAAVMGAFSFLKSGGGLARIYSSSKIYQNSLEQHPEIMTHYEKNFEKLEKIFLQEIHASAKKQIVLIGPGLAEQVSSQFWQDLCQTKNISVILDAGALKQIAKVADIFCKRKFEHLILTPHKGEALALLNGNAENFAKEKAPQNVRNMAIDIAQKFNAAVYFKGAGGLLIHENNNALEEIYVYSKASQLASGGSGDILCGIIAASLVRDKDAFRALSHAVYFHVRAAEMVLKKIAAQKKLPKNNLDALRDFFVPTDLLEELPALVKENP